MGFLFTKTNMFWVVLQLLVDFELAPNLVWVQKKAWWPVMARPRIREWISCVPSYVFTVSRLAAWRMTWYSSTSPFPPIMSLDILAISSAFPQLFLLTIETISGASFPSSLIYATRCTACKPRVISVTMSAIFFCCNCIAASGFPNYLRSSW